MIGTELIGLIKQLGEEKEVYVEGNGAEDTIKEVNLVSGREAEFRDFDGTVLSKEQVVIISFDNEVF